MYRLLALTCACFLSAVQASSVGLAEISAHMNKSLPEVYDPVTKLISTSVENNNFKYHFVLKANFKEYSWALPKVRARILETVCSKTRERMLLKQHRANLVYSYENVEGQLLGQFMVKPEQCP
jgi:hypothetical protein